jgi:hypothetical protein
VEIFQDGVDQLEGVIDLISNLGTSKDNLSAHEDQEHDLGLDHAVDKTREQLRLIRAEVMLSRNQTFQTDGELDVARTNNVLGLKVRKPSIEACVRRVNDIVSFASGVKQMSYQASG